MQLLRDVKEATKLLILLEVTTHRHSRMKPIAEKMGLTVQGISDYLKTMGTEGLIHRVGGIYAATMKGVELLQERFRDLKDFVDSAYSKMQILDVASALAGQDIEGGDDVGLFMEGGHLVAYPGRASSSQGKALYAARIGEDLAVVELEGIVDMRLGAITILRLPGPRDGGTRIIDIEAARRLVRKESGDRLAVTDETAMALSSKLGLEPHIEFGAVQASIDAAIKGLNVLLLVSEESSADIVSSVEAASRGLAEGISYKVVDLPRATRRITGGKSKSRKTRR